VKQFYVYTHARPDGAIFYVGKGHARRAHDFSPRRRTLWHRNIMLKYGRENIRIEKVPTDSEALAFELERLLIAELKDSGVELINLTSGGEGAAGRTMSDAVRAAFAKARGKHQYAKMSDESKQRILDGLASGRKKIWKWRDSPAGKAHLASLGQRSALATKNRPFKTFKCCECGHDFQTKSFKARLCSRRCQQRFHRAGDKPSGIQLVIPSSVCRQCGITYTSNSFKKSCYCSVKCRNTYWNARIRGSKCSK
jgi:hypothetical protein